MIDMPNCEVCDDLKYPRDISKRSAAAYRRIYASSNDILDSAAQGCSSCQLIRDAILAFVPDLEPSDTILVTINLQEYAYNAEDKSVWYTPSPVPFITVTDQLQSKSLTQIDLFCEEGALPSTWESIPIARRVSGDTCSTASLDRIHYWLDTCRKGHRCDPRSGLERDRPPLLPTRVVDVGSSASDPVALHASAEQERAQYLCLSHCWGKVQIVRTLQSNFGDFTREIPWHLLSRTFQDAVQVTRRLGFRYIWIDSLCIVQDSGEDWRKESAKMAQYYGSAELTLAATKSSDGNGGLFSTSEEHLLRDGELDSPGSRVYARRHVKHFGYLEKAWKRFPMLRNGDPLLSFPLLTRGWVYQERLLSPRMLHFGPDELVWECLSLRDCECSPVLANPSSGWAKDLVSMDLPKLALYRHKIGADDTVLANVWRFMVVRFTQLDLTFGTDKLPALQGCATMHKDSLTATDVGHEIDGQGQSSHVRYMSGVWAGSIPDDLLWHCDKFKPRPTEWRAPSFSWASVDSPVIYPARLSTLASERGVSSVVTCRTWTPATPYKHQFKPDVREPLHLSGVLVKGTLRYSASSLLPDEELDPKVIVDGTRAAGDPYSICAGDHDFVFSADYSLSNAGPHHVPSGATIYALRLAQRLHDDSETNSDGIDFSLILRCLDDSEQLYERIGLLDIITKPVLDLAVAHLFAGQIGRSEITVV